MRRWPWWLALAVVLLGFALRLHRVGDDALWFDEIEQLRAATLPTFRNMLGLVRSHAMALPLDYAVTRFTAGLGQGEFWLRIPAVLWGTLSLAALYRLGRAVVGPAVGLLAAMLLATWTVHVRYSQEMRSYAALGTFTLLTTLSLLFALRHNSRKEKQSLGERGHGVASFTQALSFIQNAKFWILSGALLFVGSYFHPYVLFSLAFGFGLWMVWPQERADRRRALIGLLVVTLTAGVLFLPGYLLFGRQPNFNYPLYEYGRTFWRVIGQGLGWVTLRYEGEITRLGVWEGVSLGGFLLGLLGLARRPRRFRLVAALAAAGAAQVIIIYFGDVWRGYWFLGRQLIHLAPFAMLVAAVAWVAAGHWLALRFRRPALQWVVLAGAAALMLIGLAANLADYYTYPRTTGREIAAVLAANHRAGEPIYVVFPYETRVYDYYLRRLPDGAASAQDLQALDWADLPELADEPGVLYLAVTHRATDEQLAQIAALGFIPLYQWPGHWSGAQSLFVRKIGYN